MPCNQQSDTHNLSDPTTKHYHTYGALDVVVTPGILVVVIASGVLVVNVVGKGLVIVIVGNERVVAIIGLGKELTIVANDILDNVVGDVALLGELQWVTFWCT
jgi:hypothetical protein